MPITNSEIPVVSVGDTDTGAISYDALLDDGELIASVGGVVEVTTSDLTISNVAASTATLKIDKKTVPIGRAVQFSVSGQSATGGDDSDGKYRLRVTVTTDSTPARTLVRDFLFKAI